MNHDEMVFLDNVKRSMGNFTDQFVTPISEIISENRGRAWGTGYYVQLRGAAYLLSNDHVAEKWPDIAHLPERKGRYRGFSRVPQSISRPLDVSLIRLTDEESRDATQMACPVELFDTRFQPAENELLLVGGYPGFATPAMGEHHLGDPRDTIGDHLPAQFTPILTYEVTDPTRRPSDFVEKLNVILDYERPAFRGTAGVMREPPDAGGMSGSLVWDTKIRAGGNAAYWSPESARVCGLVWGWCNDRQGTQYPLKFDPFIGRGREPAFRLFASPYWPGSAIEHLCALWHHGSVTINAKRHAAIDQIRSSKLEILNKCKQQKMPMTETSGFTISRFRDLNLFRISIFGFRISPLDIRISDFPNGAGIGKSTDC